jgi:hypothetical protein
MNWLLLALVPACFALNPVIGRALIEAFGPATLSVVRRSLSAAVIAAIAPSWATASRSSATDRCSPRRRSADAIHAADLAIALIGEQLAWYHGVALALVVTGLLLINRGQASVRKRRP